MKVQLVYPLPCFGEPRRLGGAVAHLGLWVLASHIQKNQRDTTVEVIDGRLMSQDDIPRSLNADVVGFTTTLHNYPNCLILAQEAKRRGGLVVFGGLHATAVGVNILRNRSFVDAVVIGDGERALAALLEGVGPARIENVVVRSGDHWQSPNRTDGSGQPIPVFYPAQQLPTVQFDVDHVLALSNLTQGSEMGVERTMLPVLSHKGCAHRSRRGCYFCSIRSAEPSFATPEAFWHQVSLHVGRHGIRRFHDVGDSIGGPHHHPSLEREVMDGLAWLRAAASARPSELADTELLMYVRPDDLVRPGYADALEAVNARTLYVGFESNSAQSLWSLRKGTTPEGNERALEVLDERRFRLCATFVLGAPDETDETVDETRRFALRLRKVLGDRAEMLGANLMIPFPGVPAFAELAVTRPDLLAYDLLDPNEVTRIWVELACNLSGPRAGWWDRLVHTCDEIGALAGDRVKLYDAARSNEMRGAK